jgi:phosphohistidine phosphatase
VELVIVRHGPASQSVPDREADDARELTSKGRKQTRAAMKGVARRARDIRLILTSPLPRSSQTAKLLKKALDSSEIVEDDRLRPEGDVNNLIDELKQDQRSVAIVGHDPMLSLLTSSLPAGSSGSFVSLDKGGAAALRYDGSTWELCWLATRDQLAGDS